MAIKYEYYAPTPDSVDRIYGEHWSYQTFTPQVNHLISQVKLGLCRQAGKSPGIITASIRAIDGNGKPTGIDLCSGTTNGNTLIENWNPTWNEEDFETRAIIFSSTYSLIAGIKYSIILKATDAVDSTNGVCWGNDMNATYEGGNRGFSDDSGSTWDAVTNDDFWFEEWGSPGVILEDMVTYKRLVAAGANTIYYEDI